jgi:Putative phage metallopeptidase
MTTFEHQPPDLVEVLDQALNYHQELRDADVRVLTLRARAFDALEQPEAAIKLAGCPCLAKIRVYNHKMRVLTGFDAEVVVDGHRWDELTPEQRVALLDHELTHLRVMNDEAGEVKLDDLGRPRLRTMPDDFMLTGFYDVIRRHGESANEARSVQQVHLSVKAALKEAAQAVADAVTKKRKEDAA